MKVVVNFIKIVCVVSGEESKYIFRGEIPPSLDYLLPQFFLFNEVNKLYYITGDESCGYVSSKLCV